MRTDPLNVAEAEITQLKQRVEELKAIVRRLETDKKHWCSKYVQERRRCDVLASSLSERTGSVGKIGSSSMWDQEAKILSTMFGRWSHPEDLPQLCVRALCTSCGAQMGNGLAMALVRA